MVFIITSFFGLATVNQIQMLNNPMNNEIRITKHTPIRPMVHQGSGLPSRCRRCSFDVTARPPSSSVSSNTLRNAQKFFVAWGAAAPDGPTKGKIMHRNWKDRNAAIVKLFPVNGRSSHGSSAETAAIVFAFITATYQTSVRYSTARCTDLILLSSSVLLLASTGSR